MITKQTAAAAAKAIRALSAGPLSTGKDRTVTVYLSPTLTVRASRVRRRGKLPSMRRRVDLVVTIGKPNYNARAFIRRMKNVITTYPALVYGIR